MHYDEGALENALVYRTSLDAGTRCSGLDPITVDRAMQKLLEMKTRQIEDFHSACGLIPLTDGSHLCVNCMVEWHTTRIDDS